MKALTRAVVLLLVAALALVPFAEAQQTSPGAATTQTGSTGLAASNCLSTIATTSTALTLTIPAAGGSNSIYIDHLILALYSTAVVTTTTTPLAFTSTNISGTPQFFVATGVGGGGSLAAAGGQVVALGANGPLAIPLKALSGSSPTFVGPTANAGYFDTMTVCWHVAP